jgi:hypothetical protein
MSDSNNPFAEKKSCAILWYLRVNMISVHPWATNSPHLDSQTPNRNTQQLLQQLWVSHKRAFTRPQQPELFSYSLSVNHIYLCIRRKNFFSWIDHEYLCFIVKIILPHDCFHSISNEKSLINTRKLPDFHRITHLDDEWLTRSYSVSVNMRSVKTEVVLFPSVGRGVEFR